MSFVVQESQNCLRYESHSSACRMKDFMGFKRPQSFLIVHSFL